MLVSSYNKTDTKLFKRMLQILTCVIGLVLISVSTQSHADIYKKNEVFLQENFSGKTPEPKHVWIKDDLKTQVKTILGHSYGKLRIKYWVSGNKSAWVLEEIGKEKPITTGIIVTAGKINKVEILAFRESRGWEIKYPFFLKQFINATLKGNKQLSQNVDGITGATLSVRAVTKLSRLALLLHNTIQKEQKAQQSIL